MTSSSTGISKTVGELLVLDVLTRHGIDKDHKRQLTEEQRNEIAELIENLKTQSEEFLKNHSATSTTHTEADMVTEPTTSPSIERTNESSAPLLTVPKHERKRKKHHSHRDRK